ncbi:MAG: WD40 repeat domain-containing protein [Culturomica sp.]|jgi:hypothetical protein|nr:WD40 repeat domain-containing protein [Culturomica sp.]
MKKGFLLSLIAAVLVVFIAYAVWYIGKRGEWQNSSKESFIPKNSALVLHVNPSAVLPATLEAALDKQIKQFRSSRLNQIVLALHNVDLLLPTSRILAQRREGKEKITSLWILDCRDVVSRNDVAGFLDQYHGGGGEARKYDRYRIARLSTETGDLFYAVEEGRVLLSDSELYIEDALKQLEQSQQEDLSSFQDVSRYFSAKAGVNLYLNTAFFSDILPFFLQTRKVFPHLDLGRCFKWAALDGELREDGVGLNGFMSHEAMPASYLKTLEKQRPAETTIDAVIPSRAASLLVLNLSDPAAYLELLERYRRDAGLAEQVRKRKQEFNNRLGKGAETELRQLLQGQFAKVGLTFNPASGEEEGLIIAELKSGGLAQSWVEKMIDQHARATNSHPGSYRKQHRVDRDKSFTYYKSPAEDLAAVYWGYLLEGTRTRFLAVENNYLILASSERALGSFFNDYVHRNSLKDVDWYKRIKSKLSAKYNLAYFADMGQMEPYFRSVAGPLGEASFPAAPEQAPAFPSVALQWSNEGSILYTTFFLSSEQTGRDEKPHILWQTKLDAPVSMKPVPVINHNTQEKELFVQDEQNTVYLLNDAGRILWKVSLNEPVNSDVYQVDALKNGKLQYLFSTAARLYLIDRNGDPVDKFPVIFPAPCAPGITLFDYDKNRNYRIFAPCTNREIYLYDIKGNRIRDWNGGRADNEIVSRVWHYRVGDKDYIVYADRYRLYIRDRRGQERVRVSKVFDLKNPTELYLSGGDGKAEVIFADASGAVQLTDFQGSVRTVSCGALSPDYRFNAADVTGDGTDDFVFADGDRLLVCDRSGTVLYDKKLEVGSLDFPYVYRFSRTDIRIGLLDKAGRNLILFGLKGGISKGFPIAGDSPFSIVFAENGFYLFAGMDQGSVVKYRVQR